MAKAVRVTTKPGGVPPRRPALRAPARRGLYLLTDLLRGPYGLSLGFMRDHASQMGVKRLRELEAALDWIDERRRYDMGRRTSRNRRDGPNGASSRPA